MTKYKLGDKLECITDNSRWYTKGALYVVSKKDGVELLGVYANDGYFDLLTHVGKHFKGYTPPTSNPNIHVA